MISTKQISKRAAIIAALSGLLCAFLFSLFMGSYTDTVAGVGTIEHVTGAAALIRNIEVFGLFSWFKSLVPTWILMFVVIYSSCFIQGLWLRKKF